MFIVAIPFVFWGMGDLFSGGDKNTIAKIGSDKVSVKEFINLTAKTLKLKIIWKGKGINEKTSSKLR